MCLECGHPTAVPRSPDQPASLLVPLEDDWVSPTGDPTLRDDVLSPLTQLREGWTDPAVVSTPARTGWLPPLLRRVAGESS